jgi:hypothetical protein
MKHKLALGFLGGLSLVVAAEAIVNGEYRGDRWVGAWPYAASLRPWNGRDSACMCVPSRPGPYPTTVACAPTRASKEFQ